MIAGMHAPLAFVYMSGLWAVVVGFTLIGIGALVLVIGVVCFAVARRNIELRAAGVGAVVAGLLLGLAGTGIAVFAEEVSDGELADVLSPVVALVAWFAAIVAGIYVARAFASRWHSRTSHL